MKPKQVFLIKKKSGGSGRKNRKSFASNIIYHTTQPAIAIS